MTQPLLLPSVARGDAKAFDACVERYGNLVYSLCRRTLRDTRDVEDACQEIFVALWKSAASFDASRGDEVTFVALIARRRLVDRMRTARARDANDPASSEDVAVSSASMEAYVDARHAATALAACSEEQRKVVLLAAVQGLTHAEIASALSMPLGTVKSHYARGIERIKRALSQREDNP